MEITCKDAAKLLFVGSFALVGAFGTIFGMPGLISWCRNYKEFLNTPDEEGRSR